MGEWLRGNAFTYDNLDSSGPSHRTTGGMLSFYFPTKPFSFGAISSCVTTNASYATGTMHIENRLRQPFELHDLAERQSLGSAHLMHIVSRTS